MEIYPATLAQFSKQVAKAYEETCHREEDLRRTGKLPMEPLLRIGSKRRELPAARIEADVYVSTMKEE